MFVLAVGQNDLHARFARMHFFCVNDNQKRLLLRFGVALALSLAGHFLLLDWLQHRPERGELHRSSGVAPHALQVSIDDKPAPSVVSPQLLAIAQQQRAPLDRTELSESAPEHAAPLLDRPQPRALLKSDDVAPANLAGHVAIPDTPRQADEPSRPAEQASFFYPPKEVDQTPIVLRPPPLDQIAGMPNAIEPIRFRSFVRADGVVDHVEILYSAAQDLPLASRIAALLKDVPCIPAQKSGVAVAAYYDFELQLVARYAPGVRPEIPPIIPRAEHEAAPKGS